jgi:hypothetical protein
MCALCNAAEQTTFDRFSMQQPIYRQAFADPERDSDLDMVTGFYDSELAMKLRDTFLFGTGAGVLYDERVGEIEFKATRLAKTTQARALWWGDLDDNEHSDFGNDFSTPDDAWKLIDRQPNQPYCPGHIYIGNTLIVEQSALCILH